MEQRMGSSLSGDAFAAYAAANLGYVSASEHSGYIRLWVRPSHASEQALTEAVFWLAEIPSGRVVLEIFGDDWSTTIAPLGHAIDQLCAYSDRKSLGDGYRRAETSHLPDPLRELLTLWKSLSGRYEPEQYSNLARSQLNDRLFIVGEGADHLYYEHFGGGIGKHTFAGEMNKGAPVESFSDSTYALHTAVSYHEALEKADQPSLEQVSARVRSIGGPEAQIEYTRLLLPCHTRTGERLLVGSSVVQSMIH